MSADRTFWLVALALLIAIAGEFLLIDAHWTPPPPQSAAVPPVPAMKSPAGANGAQLAEIGQRPLFLETRHPPPPAAEEAPPAPPAVNPLEGVELLGVYQSGGRGGVMIRKAGQVSRVAAGSEWEGRRLLAISATGAIFASPDGTSQELPLKRQPQQGGMAAVPPGGAGGKADKAVKPPVAAPPQGARPATPADRQAALRAAQTRAGQAPANPNPAPPAASLWSQ
jgi:hypothetical protein